jgi:hypothetical protein
MPPLTPNHSLFPRTQWHKDHYRGVVQVKVMDQVIWNEYLPRAYSKEDAFRDAVNFIKERMTK